MKYLSFSLENYKGIKNFNLNLDKNKPIVLVGLNESGKTTILEGIEHIGRHCKQLSRKKSDQLLTNGELAKIKPRKIGGQFFSDKVKFSCTFEYESNKPVYQLDFIYVFDKDTFQKYDILYNGSKLDFEDVDTFENISQNMPEIIYYSDFDLEVPTEIPFYTTAFKKKDEAVNTLKDAEEKEKRNNIPQWREILQDITNSLYVGKHISFQKDIVDYLDNDGDKNSFQDKLSGFSKHINEIITNKWLDSLPTQSSLKRIDFICDDIQRHDFKKRFAFKVISTKDNTFELSDRSKGCQWFFAFMLFTEFRKHRKPNTIFLLDEPASNLHSSVQEKVIHAINELCDAETGLYSFIFYSLPLFARYKKRRNYVSCEKY